MKIAIVYIIPRIIWAIYFILKYYILRGKINQWIIVAQGAGVFFLISGLGMFIDASYISGTALISLKSNSLLYGVEAINRAIQDILIGIVCFIVYWIMNKRFNKN